MWLDKNNNEDPYNRNAGTPKPASVGAGAGGGAPIGAGEGNQTNATPAGTNPVTSVPQQKAATIQDYLGANKEQSNQLGQQVQSGLDAVGNKAKTDINTSADVVKNQANAATTGFDSGLVNKAVSDPTSVANDPNQLSSFFKQWNASYTGPTSFEGSDEYNKASTSAADAKTQGTLASDIGGRKQILQDKFGVSGAGNKNLDQALIQHADNFGNVLDTSKQLTSIPDYLSSKAADVDAVTKNAADTTNATQTQTRNAFANSQSDFSKEIGQRTADAQAKVQANIAPLQADLKSGDASKLSADLDKLNIPADQKASIIDYLSSLNKDYGVNTDLTNYYDFNPATQVTAANAATKEDYDKAAALQKLTGNDLSGVLNPNDASKAGTFDTSANALNGKNLDQALRQRLIQAEIEKLNPSSVTSNGGSSQPGQNENLKDYLVSHLGPAAAITSPVALGATLGAGKVISGISNSINKAFGGGHKDAVVNLPGINMPPVGVPTIADAAGTKQIVDLLNKPINTDGSYHEGAVYDAVNRLTQLKDLYSKGQLTKAEYNGYATPLAQWANQAYQTIAGASSQAANSVKGAYQQLQAGGFMNPIQ